MRRAFAPTDALLLAALLVLAMFLMARSGFRRGVELMPWPDGLEYAAAAINLDHGLGPVLHFGGYSYPSRYTEGYPLLLAAAYPLLGTRTERLCLATVAMGLWALTAIYLLGLRMFGRPCALLSGLILATSPMFITYSTLVLSDVPTLAVTTLAVLALLYTTEYEQDATRERWISAAALFGVLAGFTVMIRPTNATILAGVAAAVAAAPPLRATIRANLPAAIAFAIGLTIFPTVQGWENLRHLGGVLRNGYAFWVPEVYGSLGRTFSADFLFGPTMPRNPHGNVIPYLLALTGLDGMLGGPGPRFTLYPFAAAAFAAIGITAALRDKNDRATRRIVCFGLGFLGALLLAYLFYFFTEVAFILPATFIIYIGSGYGMVIANRAMRRAYARRRKTSRDILAVGAVIALDLLLGLAIVIETASRVAVPPRPSEMVERLISIRKILPPRATIVSNISLEFLELYLAGPQTDLIGLTAFDPGERFTDYHLSRLYAKRAQGWNGPVPPVLFAGDRVDAATAKSLTAQANGGRGLYLLVAAPEQRKYADLLKDELSQLSADFSIEPIAQADILGLFRMRPR